MLLFLVAVTVAVLVIGVGNTLATYNGVIEEK